jgi:hypothetical protein
VRAVFLAVATSGPHDPFLALSINGHNRAAYFFKARAAYFFKAIRRLSCFSWLKQSLQKAHDLGE